MPTSFCQIIVHIIFATKGRKPCLTDNIHAYIAGIIKNLHGVPIIINGTENHLHILAYLPKDLGISDFIRVVKKQIPANGFPTPK